MIFSSEIITREECCICGSRDLQYRLNFEKVPIYMGVTNNDSSKDQFFDQTWVLCNTCGCIQLLKLLPLKLIYHYNHHSEVVGKVWRDHHDLFANFIAKNLPQKILEIGAAHGYLAKELTRKLPNSEYTIVEPDSNMVRPDIKIIKGFIQDHYFELKEKDCVISSHVLEHVYQPVEFITQISNHISIDTDMYISFPNMEGLIESGGLNSLNFEHTYLLDPNQAETIFKSAGFEVLDMKKYLTHSYFYHLKKRSNTCIKQTEFNNIESQSIKFLRMVESLVKFVAQANKLIDAHSGPIYLFGAHVFSQSLVFLGLKTDKIVGILDNDTGKQNNRLYGGAFQVFNPSVISELNNVMVVLNASHYQSEIHNQLISINRNIKIVKN
jgi:2-polyprenyl-3-methyl-5-hydroxy-6-metoxy-1,4-benzoquinol methylase